MTRHSSTTLPRLALLVLLAGSLGGIPLAAAITPSIGTCPTAATSLLGPSTACCPEGYALTVLDGSGNCQPFTCCTPTFFNASSCTTATTVANDAVQCGAMGDQAYACFASNMGAGYTSAMAGSPTDFSLLSCGNCAGSTTSGPNITALDLPGCSVGAYTPPSIGLLTAVTYINNCFDNLGGALPATFCNMQQLTTAIYNNNLLNGTLPACLGTMTSLTLLNLQNNQLTGSLPASLGNLGLVSVQVAGNAGLNGTVPYNLLSNCLLHLFYSEWFAGGSIGPDPGSDCSFQGTGLVPASFSSIVSTNAAITGLSATLAAMNVTSLAQIAALGSSSNAALNATNTSLTAKLASLNSTVYTQLASSITPVNAAITGLSASVAAMNVTSSAQIAALGSSNAALLATISTLAAQLTSLNSTVFTQLDSLGAAPAAPLPRSFSVGLSGYSPDSFAAAAQTAFVAAVSNTTGASPSGVNVTSVTAAAASGRHLMDAGITVAFAVATPIPPNAAATLISSSIFTAALGASFAAAGLAPPAVTTVNGAPVTASSTSNIVQPATGLAVAAVVALLL